MIDSRTVSTGVKGHRRVPRVPQLVGRRTDRIRRLTRPNAWFRRVGSCAHVSTGPL